MSSLPVRYGSCLLCLHDSNLNEQSLADSNCSYEKCYFHYDHYASSTANSLPIMEVIFPSLPVVYLGHVCPNRQGTVIARRGTKRCNVSITETLGSSQGEFTTRERKSWFLWGDSKKREAQPPCSEGPGLGQRTKAAQGTASIKRLRSLVKVQRQRYRTRNPFTEILSKLYFADFADSSH